MVLLKMSLGHFSYPLLDLCLVKWFLVFPNGLWSRAKFIFPTLGGNLSITLDYLLISSSARQAGYLTLCNKEEHRGIEKIIEVEGCLVSLFPLPTLRISGRDSCKEGRLVTAQNCEPKFVNKIFTFYCFLASWYPH